MDSPGYNELVDRRNFDIVVPENEFKMDTVIGTDPLFNNMRLKYDFSGMDRVYEMARKNGQAIRGHAFVFGGQDPNWIKRVGARCASQNTSQPKSKEDGKSALDETQKQYITTMSEYYGKEKDKEGNKVNRIVHLDVVNEPLEDYGFEPSPWYVCKGETYIDDSFRNARSANPNAKLYLNEIGAEFPSPKRNGLVKLVTNLQSRGVPIDGVGLQGHFTTDDLVRIGQLEETMRIFAVMGKEVMITEMDVSMRENPTSADYEKQSAIYQAVASMCVRQVACKGIVVWGASDLHSWHPKNRPTLFHSPGNPKPAFYKVQEILRANP